MSRFKDTEAAPVVLENWSFMTEYEYLVATNRLPWKWHPFRWSKVEREEFKRVRNTGVEELKKSIALGKYYFAWRTKGKELGITGTSNGRTILGSLKELRVDKEDADMAHIEIFNGKEVEYYYIRGLKSIMPLIRRHNHPDP